MYVEGGEGISKSPHVYWHTGLRQVSEMSSAFCAEIPFGGDFTSMMELKLAIKHPERYPPYHKTATIGETLSIQDPSELSPIGKKRHHPWLWRSHVLLV